MTTFLKPLAAARTALALALATTALLAAGCTSSAHTYNDAQRLSGRVLNEIVLETQHVEETETDPAVARARLLYLASVRDRVVEIDTERLDLMLTPLTPAQKRVVEQALETAYNHAMFLARFPGRLDPDGTPSDEETAAILERNVYTGVDIDL